MFKSLRSFNFRLYYFGQAFSYVGSLIQEVAMSWLIFKITGEAFYVGLLFFMRQFAGFLLAPFAGALSDNMSRRTILLITNICMAAINVVMGCLVIRGNPIVVTLLTLQFFQGIVTGIDMPVRQAFVKDLVDEDEHLMNAIALNSSLFNIARIIGPAIAGVLIPSIGEGMCFVINGLSYLAVVMGIMLMKNVNEILSIKKISFGTDIKEGLIYSFSHPPVRNIILVTAAIGLFGFPFNTLLPVFSTKVLNGNEQTLALLTTAVGVGSLMAALFMAYRKSASGLFILICVACLVYGSGLILFSQTTFLPLSVCMMILVGIGQVLIFSPANSILQITSDKTMTGRVISFYIMAFLGCTTLGSLFISSAADFFGIVPSLIFCGAGCVATGMFSLFSLGYLRKRMIVTLKLRWVKKILTNAI